jgi:Protein of unknown function (DUF2637)
MSIPLRYRWLVPIPVMLIVGVPAAVASYRHAMVVGERYGESMSPWLPLTTDGMLVAALLVMWDRRLVGRSCGIWPWAAFVGGMLATVGANLAAAQPTPGGWIVALWPPVAFALTLELMALLFTGRDVRAPAVGRVARAEPTASSPVVTAVAVPASRLTPPKRRAPGSPRMSRPLNGKSTEQLIVEVQAEVDSTGVQPRKNELMRRYEIGSGRATKIINAVALPTNVRSLTTAR